MNCQNFLVYLLFSALPIGMWLLVCLRLDRSAPEPAGQIFRVFLLGFLVTIPLMLITGNLTAWWDRNLILSPVLMILSCSFLIDALFEECAKYAIFRLGVYRSLHFNQVRDGFVYGMTIGLGFAFSENILYSVLSPNIWTGTSVILLRGMTTTLFHFLSGGIIGYYWGLVKFNPQHSKCFSLKGLFLAFLLHGLYNTIIRFKWYWNIVPLGVLLIGVYVVILRRIKRMPD
ncbi:hypothetical protein B6D52_03215 [Candidatus Parcubacteria bacterium 4484_255]|nr:MAG: hypothetical protein B6D52_03215 [Candidatus Parcubacteria bacterium 4484_255]